MPKLQAVVRKIFLRQLKHNRVLWPVWMRRTEAIIRQCDDMSRWVDRHVQVTATSVFWRANGIAKKLWGRGFQLDVCADMHNVQPSNTQRKLPFFSRWPSPHSSGVDMLQQIWRGKVCWCNPPFPLLPRVAALVRAQRACVAVVAPLSSKVARLAGIARGKPDVVGFFMIKLPGLPVAAAQAPLRRRLAVFFLDCRSSKTPSSFHDIPSAESFLPQHREGEKVFLRLPQ